VDWRYINILLLLLLLVVVVLLWYIKGTDKSYWDSLAPLTHHEPSDLGSLILYQIIMKERTLYYNEF